MCSCPGRCDDPARRPRRVLRVGRAARRPAPARAAGDRRRRGGARGQLRGEGAAACAPRWAVRQARRLLPAARSWCRPACRRTPRRARRCSRSSRTRRRSSRGSRSTRRSSTSAGCGGSRGTPIEIAVRLRAEVLERVGLPITVGVARTKFLAKVASGVAKPDGLLVVPPDDELDVPAPAAGRAAVGRRAGDGGEAARARASPRSARSPGSREAALVAMLGPGVRAAPARARAQPRSPAGRGRPAAAARSARSARSGVGRRRPATLDAVAGRARRPGDPPDARGRPRRPHRRAAAALRRLHPGDPLAHAAAGDRADADDPGHGARRAGARRAADRGAGASRWSASRSATSTTTTPSSSRCRSTSAAGTSSTPRSRGHASGSASIAITRAVLLGRDRGW